MQKNLLRKFQHTFMKKKKNPTLLKLGLEGNYFNIIKANITNPEIASSVVKEKSISAKIRNKTKTSTLTTFIQNSFGSTSHSN